MPVKNIRRAIKQSSVTEAGLLPATRSTPYVVATGPDGKPVTSTTPGATGTYGGVGYTVDATGVPRIANPHDPKYREKYQQMMFQLALDRPDLVGQNIDLRDYFVKDGKFTGALDHPLYAVPTGDGYTGPTPDGGYKVNGHPILNANDARNFFTRQVVAPPQGWQPGQVVSSWGSDAPNSTFVAGTPGSPSVNGQNNAIIEGNQFNKPITTAGLPPPAGAKPPGQPVTTVATGPLATGKPTGTKPITAATGPLAVDKQPVATMGPAFDTNLPYKTGANPYQVAGAQNAPGAPAMNAPGSPGAMNGPGAPAMNTPAFRRRRPRGVASAGLAPTVAKPYEQPRTSTFLADGGRAKRQPVTIEHGYAHGGEVYGNDPDGQNRRAIEAYNRILAGRNPYGALGQVGQDYLDPDQWRALPDWLRNQYYQANDDSGLTRYRLMSGVLNDPDGNEFVQIGDLSSAVGEGDNSVVDWEQVSYDPRLGMRTTGGNRRSVQSDAFRNGRLLTMLAMAAAGGYAALNPGTAGALGAEAGALGSAGLEGASGAAGAAGGAAGVAPVGTLGSGTTLAGTGLGGSWGALGTGANLTGTGLIGGTGATLAGTAVPGAAAVGGAGSLAALSPAAINAVSTLAGSAGQSVSQWLSKPENVQRLVRAVGGVANMFTSGNRGSTDVGLIGDPGTGAPGTGPGSPAGTVAPPRPVAPRPMPARPNTAVDTRFLDELDPNAFVSGNADFSRWNEARGRFKPLEDMLFGEAMRAGSAEEQEAAAGRAGADVEQAFTAASQQARNRLIAQGVNPDTEGAGLELARMGALDRAKAMAGSKNIARRAEKERGEAARRAAAGIGLQLSGQGLQADTAAMNFDQANNRLRADIVGRRTDLRARLGESAAEREARLYTADADRISREGTSDADRELRRYGLDLSADVNREGNRISRDRLNAEIQAGNLNRRRQSAADRGRGVGAAINTVGDIYRIGDETGLWRNIGSWLGGFKHGGRVDMAVAGLEADEPKKRKRRDFRDGARVEGPGSGTSDSIRARLSDGEGVLNAEAMELLDSEDPEFLDRMNEDGLKVRAARKALSVGLEE